MSVRVVYEIARSCRLGGIVVALALALSMPCASAGHVQYDAVPLGGTWEMEYLREPWTSDDMPRFVGHRVESAVPGNWEDMEQAFRDAGIDVSAFRRNPDHVEQSFPMRGWAKDTTLPNPYGCFLYRRAFDCDRTGKSVLAFDCVRNEIRVWINGCFVAFRQGFSTPFELAVPDGILKPGRNEIVLAVANTPNMGYNGRDVTGLTTRALFGATGGIEGRVELRFLKSDIGDIYVTTAADLASFTVHVSGSSPYSYSISDGTNVVLSGSGRGDVTLPTKGLEFWSPDSPKLYRLSVVTAAGSCAQLFGIRRLAASGERLRLNGRPIYLRGVTEHAYFAKTTHMPRDLAYWRMVTAKRKELGFNFVRFHTFVPPEEYLDATDELGMLVHVESPNFVPISEYAAIVAFGRRHPSVVIYCTGNETQIDEQAEPYLQDVAAIVHRETDALFSPMSALRGIEYFIRQGRDPYVNEPFPHNAERIGRMSAYCDLFTTYQLGVASYSSLNKGSPALLDRWGDAYCGKPRLSHETCIDSSYVDFTTEALYPADSPVLRAGVFSKLRAYLSSRGVLEKSDLYFRNSCEWMRRIRKFAFEKLRAADRVAGFDFLGDINTHWHTFGYSVGMMDEFYRLKPGETVENVRRYNSAAVLLSDLGSDFNVTAGEKKRVKISLSNYEGDAKDATLRVELVGNGERVTGNGERVTGNGNGVVWERDVLCPRVPCGKLAELGEFEIETPGDSHARKYLLRASFASDGVKAENEWEIYAFPKVVESPVPGNVRVVGDISRDELVAAMERGERVLLLGAGPFKSLPTTYRIGMAGRCSGNYATVIKAGHPALKGLPHDGFCGWQFRRLMEGGRAVQLEAGVPFDPIVDIASSVKNVIRQSALFEYRVGEGRLLVCSFAFSSGDPATAWLKSRLVDYAASGEFAPEQALTAAQLKAMIDAPLLTGEKNTNEARNANDPASVVSAAPRGKKDGADLSIEEFGARPDGTVDCGGDILVDGRRPKTSVNGVTLHVIGDSTSAPRRWALDRNDAPAEARYSGSWCEVAQDRYALPGVTIRNWARCGWSAKKFVDSGRWTNVLASVNRGDFVFFMLGHNDQKRQKPEVYASEADYRAYLLRFIEEVQARGAFPVLGTSIVRRRFDASGKVADGLGAYPDVVRELSRTMSIKMVDMNEATRRAVEGVSRDESLSWYRGGVDGSSDMTHPSVKGADVIARLFVERARQEAPELAALFSVGQRRGGE